MSEIFLILRTQRQVIHVHRSSCKVFVILVTFQLKVNLLDRFSKKKYSNFMKTVQWELSCTCGRTEGWTDGQTWRIAAFSNYAQVLKLQPYNSSCLQPGTQAPILQYISINGASKFVDTEIDHYYFFGWGMLTLHGNVNTITDTAVPRIPLKFLFIVCKCCKCEKIKKPMLFDEKKMATLRSVRSGTIYQRINRRGKCTISSRRKISQPIQ